MSYYLMVYTFWIADVIHQHYVKIILSAGCLKTLHERFLINKLTLIYFTCSTLIFTELLANLVITDFFP